MSPEVHVLMELVVLGGVLAGVWAGWVWLVHRQEERRLRWEKFMRPRPCVHRYMRMVFRATANGEQIDRWMQCTDCSERITTSHIRLVTDEPSDGVARQD